MIMQHLNRYCYLLLEKTEDFFPLVCFPPRAKQRGSWGHVLKPETTKRNGRNETTETSETKPPKRAKRNHRNKRNERNNGNERNGRNETTETTETSKIISK